VPSPSRPWHASAGAAVSLTRATCAMGYGDVTS
jgi:hypothetical protein